MNWCILIPLLVGAICALLGYLLGRLLGGTNNHDNGNDRIAKLEADLEACEASKSNIVSSFTAGATAIAFDAGAAKAVFGKTVKENDLTIVEGIGPKIQELFHNHDVKTWKSLSECSVDKCQRVLDSGGERFAIHKPGTWPEQARMAYEGLWSELLKWQDELDGGK
ncbi:hypothetical protein [uncultured Psychroserpens sp.]|uniref:hypothetical protein n=1 Tax=uncultured Psychroserpens sp. TaxID=255436 RepID=UPI00260E8B28|nr:hypothetical protein [uncultured Psychroserpens sp.]